MIGAIVAAWGGAAPPPPPVAEEPSWLSALLPPWRTADGRPLPVGTALLLILAASALWPSKGKARAKAGPASSTTERFAYRVDNFFSTKAYAPAALLCVITLILVVVGGLALWLATDDSTLLSMMWLAWRFLTDGAAAAPRPGPGA